MGNCKDPKSNSYHNENRFVLIQECKSGSEFCPWPTLGTVLATAAHEIHSQLALSSVGRSSPRVTLMLHIDNVWMRHEIGELRRSC